MVLFAIAILWVSAEANNVGVGINWFHPHFLGPWKKDNSLKCADRTVTRHDACAPTAWVRLRRRHRRARAGTRARA